MYGSDENVDLNIQIDNRNEDAFEAQCHIVLPKGVDYVKAFTSQNSLVIIILFNFIKLTSLNNNILI